MNVYLDNSATTRPFDAVNQRMTELNENGYGNPSSLHSFGMEAEKRMKTAKENMLRAIGAKNGEIIFTSGGTEANNLAILGCLSRSVKRNPHIMTTQIEHPSVTEPFLYLQELGARCEFSPVDANGFIDVPRFEEQITEQIAFVSVMLVNNEVGSIQPVEKLSQIIKSRNPDAAFHVDAVQGFGKVKIDVEKMGIDLLTVSGHKINGPKGVGCLYIRKGVHIKPILFGGHQENNIRSGTQNVPGIAGFDTALLETFNQFDMHVEQMLRCKQFLLQKLKEIPHCTINGGESEKHAPHIINVSFPGLKSEVLLHALEARGVFISTGSACSSNKPSLSPVLSAMGFGRKRIDSAIRISLGVTNTMEEMHYAAAVIREEVINLQKYMLN